MKLIKRFKKMNQLKRLNIRLDALETCMLTLTDLRLYLRKAELESCLKIINFPTQTFSTEIEYIDKFLSYIFEEEERYRQTKQILMKKEKSIKTQT